MTGKGKQTSEISTHKYSQNDDREFQPVFAGSDAELIIEHIEYHLGKIESVYHEPITNLVHIDINYVKPSDRYPFHIFITSGMSDLPMTVPEGSEEHKFAELFILLPKDWPVPTENFQIVEDAFKNEIYYWPIRWLKIIARFPHEFKTWIGWGHSIPNGEAASPFAENTKLGCLLLLPSISLPVDFLELVINPEKTVKFYCLYPLYKEEMEYRIRKGTDRLLERFDRFKISDVIIINRQNTCLKKGFWRL